MSANNAAAGSTGASVHGFEHWAQQAQQAASGLSHGFGDAFKQLQAMQIPADAWSQLQSDYIHQASALWNAALGESSKAAQGAASAASASAAAAATAGAAAPLKDRRFADASWNDNRLAHFTAQLYLLNAKTLQRMADQVQADDKTRARVRFAVQQFVDASSPSNFLALNPEAQQRALNTQGESLARGLQLLMSDLQRGHVSQTDESAFEVGRNVATTEGHVVFENEFFQLLEYKPLTAKVHARPLLMVPPCINK